MQVNTLEPISHGQGQPQPVRPQRLADTPVSSEKTTPGPAPAAAELS